MVDLTERSFSSCAHCLGCRALKKKTFLQVKEGFYYILAKREVQSKFLSSWQCSFLPELLEVDDTDFAQFLKYPKKREEDQKSKILVLQVSLHSK